MTAQGIITGFFLGFLTASAWLLVSLVLKIREFEKARAINNHEVQQMRRRLGLLGREEDEHESN